MKVQLCSAVRRQNPNPEHGYLKQDFLIKIKKIAIQQGIDEDRIPYSVSQSCNGMNSSSDI